MKFIIVLLSALVMTSCSSPSKVEKVGELEGMEGKYSKMEAMKDFGEPEGKCNDHTWTESCKWVIQSDEGRQPASQSSNKTLRLWFDKKGTLVKKNFY